MRQSKAVVAEPVEEPKRLTDLHGNRQGTGNEFWHRCHEERRTFDDRLREAELMFGEDN